MTFIEGDPDVSGGKIVGADSHRVSLGRRMGTAAGLMNRPGVGEVGLGGRLDGEAAGKEVLIVAGLPLGGDEKDFPEGHIASEVDGDPRPACGGIDESATPADLFLQRHFGEDGEIGRTGLQPGDLVFRVDQRAVEQAGDPSDGIRRRSGGSGGEGVGE